MNHAEEQALLDLFATIDAVYTETDCFDPHKVTIGYGRLYRAWKRTRRVLAAQSYAPLQQRYPSEATGEEQHPQEKQDNHQPPVDIPLATSLRVT